LKENNLRDPKIFDINYIYWLLKDDKEFFINFLKVLREKSIFDYNSWTFSFLHQYEEGIWELIRSKQFQESYISPGAAYRNLKFI